MRIIGLSFVLALTLAGCGVQPGKAIVIYDTSDPATLKIENASKQGIYALFPGDGVAPLEGGSVYLHPGDRFGFKNFSGKIYGFYTTDGSEKTIPLDGVLTTDYIWK